MNQLPLFLQANCVQAELIETGEDMPTVALAAKSLSVEACEIVKSIVFEGKTESTVGLAIVPGNERVDPQKVATLLGLPSLKLARPEFVRRFTGYEVGGVPPVGHTSDIPVVVDQRVLGHKLVFAGGGDEQHMLRIAPCEIVRLTHAIVGDIVKAQLPEHQR